MVGGTVGGGGGARGSGRCQGTSEGRAPPPPPFLPFPLPLALLYARCSEGLGSCRLVVEKVRAVRRVGRRSAREAAWPRAPGSVAFPPRHGTPPLVLSGHAASLTPY